MNRSSAINTGAVETIPSLYPMRLADSIGAHAPTTTSSTNANHTRYDALNRRIVKKAYDGGSLDWTDHYYYNAQWQVLEVRRDTGSGEDADPREQYVWHPYYIDALATRFYDATMGGTQVQHYFTHDANFNVTAALSDSGSVVERYHYTSYGELTVLDANFSDDADGVSDMENPYTLTGRRFDGESGLYQYRNRYYGAEVGRFVTRDPIGYADGSNLYGAYFVPSLLDPTGTHFTVDGPVVEPPVLNRLLNQAVRDVHGFTLCRLEIDVTCEDRTMTLQRLDIHCLVRVSSGIFGLARVANAIEA